jgi:hypothetical protein
MSIALRTKRPIRAVAMLLIAAAAAGLTRSDPRGQAHAQAAPSTAAPAPPNVAPTSNPKRALRADQRSPGANTGGTVIQGADTPTLVASLPWWRVDGPLAPAPDPGQDESQILTACDFWLGFPYATADSKSLTVRLAAAQHDSELESALNRIQVADPNELNAIDLAAKGTPPARSWWLRGLLATIGSAIAAGAAAAYLIIRWRRTGVPSEDAIL